jgi:hypothetical protein
MLPVHERVPSVILARIPQQSECEKARLTTPEWQILELRMSAFIISSGRVLKSTKLAMVDSPVGNCAHAKA